MKLIIIAVITACLFVSCASSQGGHCDAYGKIEKNKRDLN